MFEPSREEVRKFFMEAWQGQRNGRLLSPLEALATEVIQYHPEFHPLLESTSQETLERTWGPEEGGMNPFYTCPCILPSKNSWESITPGHQRNFSAPMPNHP